MADERNVALWPTRQNYARFAALCDDKVAPDFDDFARVANAQIVALAIRGVHIHKIAFDPDRMAQWCRANCGKVDADARAYYASFLALAD